MPPDYPCAYCHLSFKSIRELLAHEEEVHGPVIEALEDVDGNEEEQWEEEEED